MVLGVRGLKNKLIWIVFVDTPRSRRLNTDSKSNVLFYLTGHGGEDFLKFQDDEEISAYELADSFQQMYQKKRYNEFLFVIGKSTKHINLFTFEKFYNFKSDHHFYSFFMQKNIRD